MLVKQKLARNSQGKGRESLKRVEGREAKEIDEILVVKVRGEDFLSIKANFVTSFKEFLDCGPLPPWKESY